MAPSKKSKRKSGVLLHISSLPSADLGLEAYNFVDFLAATGAGIWQTLPINMPHADNSPYQCISAHAGNPAFISLRKLVEDDLISEADVALGHHQALNLAYHHFLAKNELSQFNQFCDEPCI